MFSNRRWRRHVIFKKATPLQRREQLKPYIEERDVDIKHALINANKLSDNDLALMLLKFKGRAFIWRVVKNAIRESFYE